MGGSQSTIVNSNPHLEQTSEIKVENQCDLVKCSPNNISNFCDYDNDNQNKKKNYDNDNSKLLLIYIILLLFSMFLFIFIWKLKK
jgi:hypothetical protein